MNFSFVPITEEQARTIAAWRHEGIYAFYNWDADPADVAEWLDPSKREEGRVHAVLDDEDFLVGSFGFGLEGPACEIGFGLRPDLTGRGLGLGFLCAGLRFAREGLHASTTRPRHTG